MSAAAPLILTLNGGSSSLRFAVFALGPAGALARVVSGKIDRAGHAGARLIVTTAAGVVTSQAVPSRLGPAAAGAFLLDWLAAQRGLAPLRALGHRVVHGRRHPAPAVITPTLIAELRRTFVYAPEHLPAETALIALCTHRLPHVPQVACYDTVFHRSMPDVARRLPLPRRYGQHGVERYGFHGLSYTYLREEFARLHPALAAGRLIFAHLGGGASLAAVHRGRSVDTTMGFTPASGLMMGTRSGDLDPGLLAYLARTEHMTPAQFSTLANHASGLRGVSGTSADVRDLLAREATDPRAAEALALFCYQAKKGIGAFAAVLGGVDALVFAGGIGENAAAIRTRICAGLGFLGITVDPRRNARHAPVISRPSGVVEVRVIRTDEELMIARSTCRTLGLGRA